MMKLFTNMDIFIMKKGEIKNENVLATPRLLEVTICDLKYQNKSIEGYYDTTI